MMCSTWKLSVSMTGPPAAGAVTSVPIVATLSDTGVVPPVPVVVRSMISGEPAVVTSPA